MSDMGCAFGRIDPLALAWAAGFFDGEGSTLVHKSKPSYPRLELSVAQSGHEGIPEVLLRLRSVLLGMGKIVGPDRYDMYYWKADGFAEAQAAIALLWAELGPVKRTQAAVAIHTVQKQYGPGGLRARPPRRRRSLHVDHDDTHAARPTRAGIDRAWAAGFLDGEGCFGLRRSSPRKDGSVPRRVRASASQKGAPGRPAAALIRLRSVLGGQIEKHGDPDDFRWAVEGIDRVERVVRRVRPWLGTAKQEQAGAAMQRFREQRRARGDRRHCIRGHPYSHVYMSPTGPKRKCNACARILGRRSRALRGIAPRAFRDRARRYTS